MIEKHIKDNDVLIDMFCGVAPLSIKCCIKYPKFRSVCNDPNPEAIN